MLEKEDVREILGLYQHAFPDLTERYFSEKLWPNATVVERIVNQDVEQRAVEESNGTHLPHLQSML
jgi:hypothetical protein